MEAASKAQDELERIEKQIEQLESAAGDNQEARRQLQEMHVRVDALRRQIAGQLTPWERTELARHPMRPYPLDYIERIFSDFSEIHGDRGFGDDAAMVCGMATFRGRQVLVLGTQRAAIPSSGSIAISASLIPRAIARHYARCASPRNGNIRSSPLSISSEPIRDWARKSVARPKPSPTTCARWRDSKFRSSPR